MLPSGKRAVAVRITAENTAGGFILPDDRVDVLQTIAQQDKRRRPAEELHDRTILTNVTVLAIDQTLDETNKDEKGKAKSAAIGKTATLELDPRQAELLTAAEAAGTLSLALRSTADNAEVAPAPLKAAAQPDQRACFHRPRRQRRRGPGCSRKSPNPESPSGAAAVDGSPWQTRDRPSGGAARGTVRGSRRGDRCGFPRSRFMPSARRQKSRRRCKPAVADRRMSRHPRRPCSPAASTPRWSSTARPRPPISSCSKAMPKPAQLYRAARCPGGCLRHQHESDGDRPLQRHRALSRAAGTWPQRISRGPGRADGRSSPPFPASITWRGRRSSGAALPSSAPGAAPARRPSRKMSPRAWRRSTGRTSSSPISTCRSAAPASASISNVARAWPRRSTTPIVSMKACSRSLLNRCGDHLSVLTAPASLETCYDLGEGAFERVLDLARSTVPFVVLDVPHVWTSWVEEDASCRRRNRHHRGSPTWSGCATPRTSSQLLQQGAPTTCRPSSSSTR